MATESPSDRVRLTQSPKALVSEAAERVRQRLDEVYPTLAPGGRERAEGYLHTIQAKIDEAIDGTEPATTGAWLGRSPLFRPLMDALIHELIHSPVDADSSVLTLRVLRLLAAMRGAPTQPGVDADDGEDLPGFMKGPGAFELLVEVAHDFRSPLTSILFLAEALRDGHSGPVTDVQRSQLGLVYSAAFGLASIASDVMDLARKERDLISGNPEPFAVGEVFQAVERMVRPLVEEKRLELRIVVPERWQASGHPHALSRVLLNLTTNALKFTDEGSVELGIRPLPHGRLEYYVQDTGRGISAEQRRTLFQPFKRRTGQHGDGHYFSGSGIGLSIARRLLHAMGSELTLDSSDERGTRFSFVIAQPGRR